MLPSKQFTKETTEQEQTLSFSSIRNRGIQGWYVRAIQRTILLTRRRATKDATKLSMPLQCLSRSCCVFKLSREPVRINDIARMIQQKSEYFPLTYQVRRAG